MRWIPAICTKGEDAIGRFGGHGRDFGRDEVSVGMEKRRWKVEGLFLFVSDKVFSLGWLSGVGVGRTFEFDISFLF